MKLTHPFASILKALAVVVALMGLFQAWPGVVQAQEAPASIVVTSAEDSGPGTLRQALADVATGGTITFGDDMTIHLASTLTLGRDVTIDGTGHAVTISGDSDQDGAGEVRVFDVHNVVGLTLNNLTIEKGVKGNDIDGGGAVRNYGAVTATNCTFSGNSAGSGGAIFNYWRDGVATGILNVTGCTFSANTATFGAAIYNAEGGTATVTGSTFSGNSAAAYGGGIYNYGGLTVTNCTFSGNSATYDGGGIFNLSPSTIRNSIVANSSGGNCWGAFVSSPNSRSNVADDDSCGGTLKGFTNSPTILLGPLGSYGGSTQTVPLLPGSYAIDRGYPSYCPAADQRGMARVGTCDIGAFESQKFTLGSPTGTPQTAYINHAFAQPLGLTVAANNTGEPVDGGLVTLSATTSPEGASATLGGDTATISAGTASVTATANGTPGSYTVSASTHGAPTGVSFALTNLTNATIVVTSAEDSGPGTLRQALADVATGGTITFGDDMTIHLASTLTLGRDVTIDGTGHAVTISGDSDQDGAGEVRVFDVHNVVGLTLNNLTIEKGVKGNDIDGGGAVRNYGAVTATNCTFSGNSAGSGGAIFNYWRDGVATGILNVTGCTFSANTATFGAAIYNAEGGTATVTGSTFSGNSAAAYGGGIYNYGGLTVTNCTFSGNSATYDGGGIFNLSPSTIRNSIVANSSGGNCWGAFVSSPNSRSNVADDDSCGGTLKGFTNSPTILLGPLGSYGGSTQTVPLLPGSYAIDRGYPSYCPAADQRGMARVGTCDIGAFESQKFTLGSPTGTPQTAYINHAFAEPLGLTVAANNTGEPVDGGLVTLTPPGSGASATLSAGTATIGGDGTASVTATANGTPGSYTVTASTHGAPTGVSFALTNTYPQPVLDGISPASALVGSGDLTLQVTGSGFVQGSVVRWNGVDLVTSYSGDTQLSAPVPAGNLAAVQTAQVTLYTPGPGGGTSSVLAFFVTEAAAGVVDQTVSSGTDPTAGTGPASATATGEGLLAVAEYDANPGGTPSFVANGTYFDVYAAPGNTFSQVSIVACGLYPNDKLYWWDAGNDRWEKAGPQSYDQDTGCVTLVVDASSSPSLSQLQGTYFAAGVPTNTPPVANPGGPYLGAINAAIVFDGSGSSDPDGDPLAYAWDLGDGNTGSGVAPTPSYAESGVYDVCLVVNDGTEDSLPACTLAVVYDPDGGFVTGGGWIDSPPGAYLPDPALTGKATFGFVSKYQKGAQVPTGTTEFQFQAGGFNFHSEAYEWLVVNQGSKNAQFKGSGTVNGGLDPNGNEFKFMIWATDGSPDTFRIRIWYEANGSEIDVYDNGVDQALGGGSIVVHTK
ncbi:MAG TPA: choice-of-anchor Q domain-containing protein [Anaerolineae bacterium]|nr:choice-of-anchor Q domain-containing protein [Anaerolineae bacterium]